MIPYTITNETITVVHGGKTHTVRKGTPNFIGLRDAILEERWADVPKNLTIQKSLQEWAKGKFTVDGNRIYYNKAKLPEDLNQRIMQMATNGDDPTPLFNFWERLQENPSYRSVKQLFAFLQNEGIPLTLDGCFLAYKSVRPDFKDHHTGTVDNKVGVINKMPRNEISDDPQVACHEGYHVGALGYAQSFGSDGRKIIICKVDPKNVVCVPYDHSQQKMRVCEYEVIGHHNGAGEMPNTICLTPKDEQNYCEPEGEGPEDDGDDVENDLDDGDECDCECHELGEEDDCDCCTKPKQQELPLPKQGKVVDLMDEEADKGVKPVEGKRKSKKGWTKFDKMDMTQLMEQPIHELRWYAGRGLSIVGASKIPGGKSALVTRILQVRE